MSLNYQDSPKGIVLEVEKSILYQISILLSNLTEDNWLEHYDQINYILSNSSNSVNTQFHIKVLSLLYLCYSNSIPSELSPIEKLFQESFKTITASLFGIDIYYHLFSKLFKHIKVLDFINRFDFNPFFALYLIGTYQKHFDSSINVQVLELTKNLIKNIDFFDSNFDFETFLHSTVANKLFPTSSKLLFLNIFEALQDSELVEDFEQLVYKNLPKMSFKEILVDVGNELNGIHPNNLLKALLKIDKKEIDSSLAFILSELLIPGSQKLPANTLNLTSANSLPESTAKGSQLQVCFKSIDSDPNFNINWYLVFSKAQENLFDSAQRGIQPSVPCINEFITAIDFKSGLLDIALNYDWYFSKQLLFAIHSLDPKVGAYDITLSPFLSRCFGDDTETPIETQLGKKNVISFINVGKLEFTVMSQINKPQNESLLDNRSMDSQIANLFQHHVNTFPEYILLAAIAIVTSSSSAETPQFISSFLDGLFDTILTNNSKFLNKVFESFKELDTPLLLKKCLDYYSSKKTSDSLLRIIKPALDLDYFDKLLSYFMSNNILFAVNLVMISTIYGYDCKPFIESILDKPVAQAILDVLELKSTEDSAVSPDRSKVLGVATVYYLLSVLNKNTASIDASRFKSLQLQLLTTYPRLINFGCGHDEAILVNERNSNVFSEPIEQEMKSYYSKMYSHELDIQQIVNMLVQFKTSDIPHDQDVFSCMIHSLLDEYRFFSEYPLSALASTSLLFGALLQRKIIQGTTLTVALNFIWESCNQPPDSHLFKFAVQALYNFKSRLHEYPNYCKHLLECASLSTHSKMYQIVKDASNGIACEDQSNTDTGNNSSGEAMTNRTVEDDSGIKYQSINIIEHAIGTEQQEKPNEKLSDKLLFFINNLTGDNLKSKIPEVKGLLTENFFLWFADYLVADRAKSEPNNHKLYCELVKEFENPIFYEYIISVTLREVVTLIKNFKNSLTDRTHLKNLGSWLGQITLASDKPLKRSLISLKFLLVEAYDFKTIQFIIPFVCKVLDQAQYSKIFKLPNPWVLGVLRVLVELYDCADLKLNLKFEVEVLLNTFNKKVTDIEPSNVIRNHNPNPVALAILFGLQPNPNAAASSNATGLAGDFNKLNLEMHQQIPHAKFQPAQMPQPPMVQQQMMQQTGGIPQRAEEVLSLPNGPQQAQPQGPPGTFDTSFNSLIGNTIFTTDPNLRRAFQASLSRAVRECLVPIASKAADSVITTTEALVKKDFAYEGDAQKLRKAYQNLAIRLAQSVIGSTGRKVLIETIEAFMIQLLTHQFNPNDFNLAELNSAIQANVDLCVDMVSRFAMNLIIDAIEQRMSSSVSDREQYPPGRPFVESGADGYALNLQLPLGLKPEGLIPTQLAVYENFGANVTRPEALDQAQAQSIPPQALQQTQIPPQVGAPASSQTPQVQTANTALAKDDTSSAVEQLFNVIIQNCDKAIQSLTELKEKSLSEIPQDHIILQSITNVLALAQSNALKFPELLLKVAQYAVNCLFTQTNDNPINNEIFVVILDKLCEYSPSTAKDVTWWLIHSSDQRKLNIPVMHSLLKVQLVQPSKLDSSISRLIVESKNPTVVKFASTLLYNIFSEKDVKPFALRSEFGNTLKALASYNEDDSIEHVEEAKLSRDKLFELLKDTSTSSGEDMYTQMGYIFSEWYRLSSHGECTTSLKTEFIKGLHKNEILADSELFSTFFKAAIEIALTSFATEHDIRTRTQHETILIVDSLASLIVEIIIRFDKSSVTDAMIYLKNIIGIILVSFTNDHEAPNGQWNERVYFRFFSSLLCYWNDASMIKPNATAHMDSEFFNFMAEIFNSIQPMIFPGFTFAWISLISHRMFLPRVLELPEGKGYDSLVKVLTSLLKFESFYSLDETATGDVINVIFKAINRIFTGLYHDYPEFLSENYIQLLSAIPNNFIQLRNIVLSATPKHIKLENPFTPGLKVERIEELKLTPAINYQPGEDLVKCGLKKAVDNFLRIPAPGLIKTIYNSLKLPKAKKVKGFGYDSITYNVNLINSLVLYVILSETQDNTNTITFNSKGPHVSLFYDLLNFGSTEFKYHLINALANQLRYPNTHTHLLVGIFLHFFSFKTNWSNSETKSNVQELITRVLIERHSVNKPHQWGLTILFTELIKNDNYNFFELPFVKNSPPEIKMVFDGLLNNINGS